ncbi:MAG: LLM class flavin-dependent oxidoreductase [Chloroflexia bacterium]|nr:LLM class flavin-dependent oxidoreductase [Chloroflexia bacterium]MDQ3411767.1 LLM class flavin-dependent oxidoreductase [Chloroflexota bacterium]
MPSPKTAYSALRFGANIDPNAADPEEAVARAQLAEEVGFELALMQDHPYNREHLDTWTTLGAVAAGTSRITVGSNVSPLPLRPPVMLAKAVATLSVLTHGRVILGLGAGGFPDAIAAFGGPRLTPAEAVDALDEGIRLIRRLWADDGATTFAEAHYHARGARFGPKPAAPIPIWIGGFKPRMLRLTGRLGDGILLSAPYVPLDHLPALNAAIDDAAIAAGRSPASIRRAYNVMGDIAGTGGDETAVGTGGAYAVDTWVRGLIDHARTGRIDTFIFWPNNDRHARLRRFAAEVFPAVRDGLGF